MKITQDVREYTQEHGVEEEKAIAEDVVSKLCMTSSVEAECL